MIMVVVVVVWSSSEQSAELILLHGCILELGVGYAAAYDASWRWG